jgi:hypothetical protein
MFLVDDHTKPFPFRVLSFLFDSSVKAAANTDGKDDDHTDNHTHDDGGR